VLVGPIPKIVLGTARMGSVLPNALLSASDRGRAFGVLDAMLELGCSAFDLAPSYQLGGTERFFGEWIATRRNRARLFLISKGGHPYPVFRPHRISRAALSADLHASLRRLRVERLDLFLLHRDDERAQLETVLETLTTFQRQGKVAAWGVSNWTHLRVGALDGLARAAAEPSVAASSPHFSLLEWTGPPWPGCVSIAGAANADARAYYARQQVPVLAWSPLGAGYFSANPRRAMGARGRHTYCTAENARRRRRAEVLARKYVCRPAQIALAYLCHQPFPVSPIVSATTVEHMTNNLAATRLPLSAAEVRWLEHGEGSADFLGDERWKF
jgi:aryl-alcohol dehydrogenase-like predicted oxidoreductase